MYQNLPNYYQYGGYVNPYQQQPRVPNGEQQIPMVIPQMPVPPSGAYLKGRPVVSLQEARAAQIDLDGSMSIFTDIGNKKIYTKQLNKDGTASLNTYILQEGGQQSPPQYITKEEFAETIAKIEQAITALNTTKKVPVNF